LSVQKHLDDRFHNQNLKRGVSTIRGFSSKVLNLKEKKNIEVWNKNGGLMLSSVEMVRAPRTREQQPSRESRVSPWGALHLVHVQFLRDWLAADFDFGFVLARRREIICKLHLQLRFLRATESLG
jgi:hypothetical protein